MNNNALDKLYAELEKRFSRLKNYKEAIRSLSANAGGNYITVDNSQFCSVDDAYDTVLFFLRESAAVQNVSGSGKNQRLTRLVTIRLVVNSRSLVDELDIVTIINSIPLLAYVGSSYDQSATAQTYFGITERNTQSAFFNIQFTLLETIVCKICN